MADINKILKEVNKKFGEGTIGLAKDVEKTEIKRLSSGSVFLDWALGSEANSDKAGWALGRIVELYGTPSSGKSFIALQTIKKAQEEGLGCVYVDCENTFDKDYAQELGVDTEKLIITNENMGETVIDLMSELLKADAARVFVVDSIASMVPKAEVDEPMEQPMMAQSARVMSRGLRKLIALNKNEALFIMINQIRTNPGKKYGCIHGDTKVPILIGSEIKGLPIKEIVDNEIKGKVWSYDKDQNSFVLNSIKNWYFNGEVKSKQDYLSIKTNGVGTKNGVFQLTVTPEHKLLTDRGWVQAENLTMGDKLVTKYQAVCPPVKKWRKSYVNVLEIRVSSDKQFRVKGKYDLGLEKCHNYLVGNMDNGVIVHNSPEYTPGGKALGFYSSIRVEVRQGDWLFAEDKKTRLGQAVKFKITKNKTGAPFRTGYFNYIYHQGIDNVDELISIGLLNGEIQRKGAYYYIGEDNFQGRDALYKALKEDKKLFKKLKELIYGGKV